MTADRDFSLMLNEGYSLVTVSVLYHLPDHRSLLNEFVWQTLDLKPSYPRIGRFLDFWRREIDAVIREVRLGEGAVLAPAKWRNGVIIPLN